MTEPALTFRERLSANAEDFDQIVSELLAENERLNQQNQTNEPALKRYTELMDGSEEMEPIERLRFFCSLALSCQDWLDIEPFIDEILKETKDLREDRDHWKDLGTQAANFVEVPIVMRTHFTGKSPYVGWQGLGLALTETLERNKKEIDDLNANLREQRQNQLDLLEKLEESKDLFLSERTVSVMLEKRLAEATNKYNSLCSSLEAANVGETR